jgi:hypothetical protein
LGLWFLLFPHGTSVRERVGRLQEPDEAAERPVPPRQGAAPVTCEGKYEMLLFAIRKQPFPVKGRGRLTVSPKGLEVSASRAASTLRSLGLFAALALIVGGGCMLAIARDLRWIVPVLGGAVLWVPFSRMKGAGGEPLRMRILWASVASFFEDEEGRVVIEVKNAKPRGEIRFAPDRDAAPLLRALRGEGA